MLWEKGGKRKKRLLANFNTAPSKEALDYTRNRRP